MACTVQDSNNDNVVKFIKCAQFAGPEVHNYNNLLIQWLLDLIWWCS